MNRKLKCKCLYKIIRSSCILIVVLHVHPLLLILSSLVNLLPLLYQLVLDLRNCLLDLLIKYLSAFLLFISTLVVLLEILIANGPLVEFKGAIGEHINGLDFVAGIIVQLFKDFS